MVIETRKLMYFFSALYAFSNPDENLLLAFQ